MKVKDLIKEINNTVKKGERVLVTTLTKRMAEDLTDYLAKEKIKVRYMHSEIESLDRIELIKQLREGEFDVLVGINLLREGLDIPEVSLVTILDADKEGFLRDTRSLIQIIGRAARNIDSRVVLYADKMTDSIKNAIKETNRKREMQKKCKEKNKINLNCEEVNIKQKTDKKMYREMEAINIINNKLNNKEYDSYIIEFKNNQLSIYIPELKYLYRKKIY